MHVSQINQKLTIQKNVVTDKICDLINRLKHFLHGHFDA